MGAHLALTQEDEDRNLGAVPLNLRNNAGRLRHQFRKLWAAEFAVGIDTSVPRQFAVLPEW